MEIRLQMQQISVMDVCEGSLSIKAITCQLLCGRPTLEMFVIYTEISYRQIP